MRVRGIARIALAACALALPATGVAIAASSDEADDAASAAPATSADTTARIERQLAQREDDALTEAYPPPDVTAQGWLVYDAVTDEPVAGIDATTPRPIASLAKLMTALVAVERVQPDEEVEIPAAVNELGGDAARMDARAGETWPARDLLRATLAHSANDAALALALHVGDGSEERFVELMNERAAELGLDDTTFASATGLDAPGKSSTSTPVDLVALADVALRDDAIRAAVAEDDLQLTSPAGRKLDVLPNRNPLLGTYEGVDGVKTGFTDAAGYMLVVHHVDAETDGELLVATFASSSEATRISDARALLDWARPLRQDLLVVEGGTALGSIPVQRSDERVDVFACDDLYLNARVGQRLMQEVVVPRSVAAPIAEGDELGELRVRAAMPGEADAATDDGDAAADDGGAAVDDADATSGDADSGDAPLPATVAICAGERVRARSQRERFLDYATDYRAAWRQGVDEVEDSWSSLTEQAG